MAVRPRPLCRVCGKNQAVKAGGVCKTCPVPEITTVRLDAIDLAASWQPREQINKAVVASYAEIMDANQSYDPFPPVVVFRGTDGKSRLGDGFQRVEAAFDAGLEEIPAEVREGEYEDAKLFAASANASHGERMTSADKRRAIAAVLEHPEGGKWSDGVIARWCGVTPPTVAAVRKSTPKFLELAQRVGRDGRTRDTSNIGAKTTVTEQVASGSESGETDETSAPVAQPTRTVDRSEGEPETPDKYYVEHDDDAPENTPEASVNGTPDGTPQPPEKAARKKPKPTDHEDESGPTDPAGVEIPVQAAAAFALRKGMHAACRKIDALAAEVKEIGSSAAGVHLHYQSVETHLKNARQSLWAARPTHVCPYCVGHKPDCQACKGQGWVTARLYDAAPASLKGGA
jgi:hypothetical protein